MKMEALLSHIAGPGSCCLLLLTALLYVLIAVHLLRRHYAGEFIWFVHYYVIDRTMKV
jgi:hypothetical protein